MKRIALQIFGTLLLTIHSFTSVLPCTRTFENASPDLKIESLMLGKSTFRDVKLAFGDSEPFRKSPHDESEKMLCYTDGKGVVSFESGPLGGWDTVTSYSLATRNAFERKILAKCIAVSKSIANISVHSGLKLGATKAEVMKILGCPTRGEGRRIIFARDRKLSGNLVSHDEVTVLFNRDRVTRIDFFIAEEPAN